MDRQALLGREREVAALQRENAILRHRLDEAERNNKSTDEAARLKRALAISLLDAEEHKYRADWAEALSSTVSASSVSSRTDSSPSRPPQAESPPSIVRATMPTAGDGHHGQDADGADTTATAAAAVPSPRSRYVAAARAASAAHTRD